MIWLSGGALVMCLVMIIGLLALCVWYGTSTFWPTPIYRLELVDGTVHMGEVTRFQEFTLTQPMARTLKGQIAEAAQEAIGDDDTFESRRWLLRTGNFELTKEHFNWVSDFEIAAPPS